MAAWLDLVAEDAGWSLLDTGRLEEITQGMSHPKTQYPLMIHFAGNSNRIKAIRALFPRNNVTRKGPAGLVQLHLSTTTAHTSSPIIFSESKLFPQSDLGDSKWPRHLAGKHRKYSLPPRGYIIVIVGEAPTRHTESDRRAAQCLLQEPHPQLAVGEDAIPDYMRVVIVQTESAHSSRYDKPEKTCVLLNASVDTEVLDLRHRANLSDAVAFEPLRRLLLDRIHAIRIEQSSTCPPFSAYHLNVLWKQSIQHYGRRLGGSSFDCLSVARSSFPQNSSLGGHVKEFVQQAKTVGSSENDVYAFVASAFLMDAYPPGMHRFSPTMLFTALYQKHCLKAWGGASSGKNHLGVVTHFVQNFTEMGPKRPTATIRRDRLAHYYRQWGGLHSITTCFVCLCRPPEHMMPCKHTICDNCVTLFGNVSSYAEYHTDLSECPICGEDFKIIIRRLPPTKRPVIFSLDGGGTRGIIQLGLLRALEKRLLTPIAQIPDLCTGTSVGALSAMDIIFNESSAEESFAKFPALARKIFESSRDDFTLPIRRCIQWFGSAFNLTTASQYDSKNLAEILQAVIGPHRRMFDIAATSPAGCRVAVIASRTSDGKACVLANYHGVGLRDPNAAYQFLIPRDHRENPKAWEAALCSVAAPFYFQTKTLPGFGPLQDGGVRANNPLAIAMKESGIIWPRARRPDLLLSIGTGFTSSHLDSPPGSLDVIREGALFRLFRATMSSPSMDGEQGFYEALNYIPNHLKPDVFRLNHAINGPLPQLDDINQLRKMSQLDFTVSDSLVRALLASAFFFFELDETPVPSHGVFHCQGSILCSRSKAGDILERVLVEFPGARFQAASGHYLGRVDQNDCCQYCGHYRKRVKFSVNSLEEMISIEIATNAHSQRVGGFPKSAQELLDDQQAHAHFGRADHQAWGWPPNRSCYCSRGTKRQIELLEPPLEQKRPRL
ncbi:hypothetical protein N7490_006529 [Penicillium lividum]|nr:hypothetical protein N7490_006529 [Penicillium lividum]